MFVNNMWVYKLLITFVQKAFWVGLFPGKLIFLRVYKMG